MNKKIETCSLAIISKLPQICKPNEFMVAYFIINTMALQKTDRVKMYRGELADLCNMSERNISRITDSLNELGVITKDLIGDAEKKKTFNYYRLNWQKIEEILTKLDNEEGTFLPELSGLKKERIEEKKNKRIYNNKKQFDINCNIEKIEETYTEEDRVDKELERELEKAIEQTSIPMESKKVEVKKQFVPCTSPIPKKSQVPNVEDMSQYLKRIRTYVVKTSS